MNEWSLYPTSNGTETKTHTHTHAYPSVLWAEQGPYWKLFLSSSFLHSMDSTWQEPVQMLLSLEAFSSHPMIYSAIQHWALAAGQALSWVLGTQQKAGLTRALRSEHSQLCRPHPFPPRCRFCSARSGQRLTPPSTGVSGREPQSGWLAIWQGHKEASCVTQHTEKKGAEWMPGSPRTLILVYYSFTHTG